MRPNEIQAGLTAAVREALETMCFTEALESAEGTIPIGDSPDITAEVRFTGSLSGGFRVSVPWEMARKVGAGFLGLEERDVSPLQSEEVVCELTNIICGSVLGRLHRAGAFQISHPEMVVRQPAEGIQVASFCRRFHVGDGQLTAAVHFQAPV